MKNRQFKLCTTSFIVPDNIIPNIRKLGPFFDEIELLVFESHPESVLPSQDEVQTLAQLSKDHNLTYNVHLPVDISLSCGSTKEKDNAENTLVQVVDLLAPIAPTSFTLHLELPEELSAASDSSEQARSWQKDVHSRLGRFLSRISQPERICIETLNYPFSMIEPMIRDLDCSICIDIGHGIKYGYDWQDIYNRFKNRVLIVHLHGVDFTGAGKVKDHTRLDMLPREHQDAVFGFLNKFDKAVSLEVFNYKNLTCSLEMLSKQFTPVPVLDFKI